MQASGSAAGPRYGGRVEHSPVANAAARLRITAGTHVSIAVVAACCALLPAVCASAQVSAEVEIREGDGRALVRNASAVEIEVSVAIWESEESASPIQLVRAARGQVWPTRFRLMPGETQTVRLRLPADAYDGGTLLRLETRLVPVTTNAGPQGEGAQVVLATRILSKVWVR